MDRKFATADGRVSENAPAVLLVEDDPMVRGWVRDALEQAGFRLLGETAGIAGAIELLERRGADVLLVDYRLRDGRGTALVRELRQRGVATPVLLMSAHPQPGLNSEARAAGAQGTVLKTGRIAELLDALATVAAGAEAFDQRHPRWPAGQAALSPREREVLTRLADGSTNPEIAAELGVSNETVKTLVTRTYAKLGARRRAEAVTAGHDRGLL